MAKRLSDLKVSEVKGCSGCPMAQKFPDNNFVPLKPGKGLRLVVAEAPGEQEAIELEPLVGGSGRRFDALCRAAGVRRDDLTLVNTIQCRPPNNLYPTDAAARSYISASEAEASVTQCYRNHVKPVLESRPWQRVDLLGDKALFRLSGKHGIFDNRGFPVGISDLGNRPLGLPTLHPAYVARDQIYAKVVISDLSKGMQLAPEKYIPYPGLDDVSSFKAKTFVFDIENDPRTLDIFCVGLSAAPYTAMCVPFRGAYIPELRRIFREAEAVIGHNSLQHDEPILKLHDVRINEAAQHWDTMLMQHLLMPDLPHDLEFVASVLINKQAWKKQKRDSEEIYNCRDADATFQIWQQLLPMLRKEKLLELYLNTQVPLARICLLMRETGIKVDPKRVGEVREKLQREMAGLELQLPQALQTYEESFNKREPAAPGTLSTRTGKPIRFLTVQGTRPVVPWRSGAVLATYLYTTLALPPQLHVKTKEVTVDKTALDKLARKLRTRDFEKHPKLAEATQAIAALKAIKKLATLLSGFATDKLAKAEIVHTHFNVHGTASGRLSSSDPNLQNQPESARYLYVPRHTDWEFLEVDYTGIENRLTAYLADDQERLKRFLTMPDFSEHRYACEVFFGIPYDEVEKDNDKDAPYGKAKRIVHGCNYGLGARKLALMYDMSEPECKMLIAKWKAAISKTTLWQERLAKNAERDGVLTTPFGRKRWFWTDSVYTESLSFIPQSSAADIIFRAMIGLMFNRINLCQESARLVSPVAIPLPRPAILDIQCHDSLLFEYPRPMREQVATVVKAVMEQGWPELSGFSIPIGMKTGMSWGEMEDYVLK